MKHCNIIVENWIACCELFSQPSYQQDPEVGTPTAADLYSKTHNKKNGEGWVSDVARENYEKMVEIQSQSTTESGAPKDVDIFTQVLGTRSGYVRGLGRSVKPIAASSSTVSIQRDPELVRELEAAKATIEELKARQSEYDNLKNQQAEMQEAQRQIQEQLQLLKHNLRNEIRRKYWLHLVPLLKFLSKRQPYVAQLCTVGLH
ncbi:hypothetical protein CJ030_MR0G021698 [Morella rubra]|uniref:Uncharacterized protein n=1 Tax=Morella rubra TaxID=262757 RepID=A0A6A1UGX7_9ROSI|nr:hypothetical protein CJ030_MR0G021698 [Morella rubra]